jgi:hypothetical protein
VAGEGARNNLFTNEEGINFGQVVKFFNNGQS